MNPVQMIGRGLDVFECHLLRTVPSPDEGLRFMRFVLTTVFIWYLLFVYNGIHFSREAGGTRKGTTLFMPSILSPSLPFFVLSFSVSEYFRSGSREPTCVHPTGGASS